MLLWAKPFTERRTLCKTLVLLVLTYGTEQFTSLVSDAAALGVFEGKIGKALVRFVLELNSVLE